MSRVSAGTDCRFLRAAAQAVFCGKGMSMRLPGFPAGTFRVAEKERPGRMCRFCRSGAGNG